MKSYDIRTINLHNETTLYDDTINEMFNSTLVFDFIDRNNIKSERDLENKLLENITRFILELGKGFAYIGKQYKLEIANGEYYPDLVFYNYILHSFVIIDLKMTPYKPEYLGKMIFYVNIANDILKGKDDNPTIGLLLITEQDTMVAKYSSIYKDKNIFVSKYMTCMPTEEELQIIINEERRIIEEYKISKK